MKEKIRKEEKPKFIRKSWGDSETLHDVWQSDEYLKARETGFLPNITEVMVFVGENPNSETETGNLKDGRSYEEHRTVIQPFFKDEKWFMVKTFFGGKLVREIKPVLPES